MTLINRGSSDTLLQLNVLSWTQDATGDVLAPTREVLANPGVFLLKGGEQQVARFALRTKADVQERSYRIVIQEVPRQRVENGLATVLRLMVPIFVPTPNPNVAVEWNARQIKKVDLSGDTMAPVSKTVNLYVLPGATGTIRMPPVNRVETGTVLKLAAESDQAAFSASVRVGASEGVSSHP